MAAEIDRVLNDATSQFDRRLGAPAPGLVEVDGRSLAQIIAFAAQYGALIAFYDLDNQVAGNWERFFSYDPAVSEALHAALDLPDIEQALYALLAEVRAAEQSGDSFQTLLRLLAIVARLLGILDRRRDAPADPQALITRFANRNRDDSISEPLGRLQRQLGAGTVEDGLSRGFGRGRGWSDSFYDILEDLVMSLIAELRAGVQAAQEALVDSLGSGGHQPQAALYNSFALLFVEARATLNDFPRRLVKFYYGEVLEQRALPAKPDQLFLTFTRTKDAEQASVPLGQLFPASTDSSGRPINYAADAALEVTPATVKQIAIHRVTYDMPNAPNTPSAVLTGLVDLDPQQPAAPTPFPMFGMDSSGHAGALKMRVAELGFCLGSPLLLLAGGTRCIEIDFTVSMFLPSVFPPPLTGGNFGPSQIARAIQQNLVMYYSTAGGWVQVEGLHVSESILLGTQATIYTIAFTLPPDAPPLEAIDAKPAPCAPPPPLPANAFPGIPGMPVVVASVDLDQHQRSGAYALLTGTRFDELTLRVNVHGLDKLTLTTPNGPADTTQNFALFGLPPARGSALDIYAPELFVKPIDSLSLHIAWVGLPVTSGGFLGYYRNYVINADGEVVSYPLFDNTSFRVSAQTVNPGYWDADAKAEPYLFQTAGPPPTPVPTPTTSSLICAPVAEGQVAPSTILDVPGIVPMTAPPYYNYTSSALRLTLAQPSYAFGNILYQNNLMYAAQKAIPKPTPSATPASLSLPTPSASGDPTLPPLLPNAPWLPMASALSVDYSATLSTSLTLSSSPPSVPPSTLGLPTIDLYFWHLGPFDALQPVDPTGPGTGLLPDPGADAALYIQLSAPVSQVALLFTLSAGPNGWWEEPPDMAWEQQVDGQWIACPLLGDTTGGLKNSGIVTLAPTVARDATVAPPLRVRALGKTDNAPIVQSVIANALTASWCGPGGAAELGTPLPAATITKSASTLAGVASISQPMQSYGGSPPAVGHDFDMWMAERLRHKGYAIDAWDYARLVLQAMPSLWQVAVVPAVDEKTGRRAPGKVWVVVVAGPTTPNVTDATVPQADLATLAEVGDLLEASASPFAEIVVTNPPYMRLTVRATLDFTDSNTSAYWIDQLDAELIAWLSPWPDPNVGPRPDDYYTTRGIAEFIRGRSYVLGILHLHVSGQPVASGGEHRYHYLTSATSHDLRVARIHATSPACADPVDG